MSVKNLVINEDNNNRRVDNYLISILKNVPKSKIYKIIRRGEVRINSSRVKASYKLKAGDKLRIPPNIYINEKNIKNINQDTLDLHTNDILFENSNYLITNKNANISVHGGTKNNIGLIDIFRKKFNKDLDLCHRLDKNTTGCLVLAKNKKSVLHFNKLLKDQNITKKYHAILKGQLKQNIEINEPIYKDDKNNKKISMTQFNIIETFNDLTLVEVIIFTGRTHQIRIHSKMINHPILFDSRYGDLDFNKTIELKTVKNIALHAKNITFKDMNNKRISADSPYPESFILLLNELNV